MSTHVEDNFLHMRYAPQSYVKAEIKHTGTTFLYETWLIC